MAISNSKAKGFGLRNCNTLGSKKVRVRSYFLLLRDSYVDYLCLIALSNQLDGRTLGPNFCIWAGNISFVIYHAYFDRFDDGTGM